MMHKDQSHGHNSVHTESQLIHQNCWISQKGNLVWQFSKIAVTGDLIGQIGQIVFALRRIQHLIIYLSFK